MPILIILTLSTTKFITRILKSSGLVLFLTGLLFGCIWIVNSYKDIVTIKILKEETNSQSDLQTDKVNNIHIIKMMDSVLLEFQPIKQFPELPRGCEVTSLAMLLQSAEVSVDKLTLAKQVHKENTPYKTENSKIYYGHPNDGFIGNMYSYSEQGLGVYHKPIAELAEYYLPGKILDFTGAEFEEIKIHLSDNRPVWVITNTLYKELSPQHFITWQTPKGRINITYKMHSVLITGYDQDYIYFNDPYTGKQNKKAPLLDFEKSWVQMGRQAITYLP